MAKKFENIENHIEKAQKNIEKNTEKQEAPPSAAPQGGAASRRPLGLLVHNYFALIFCCFLLNHRPHLAQTPPSQAAEKGQSQDSIATKAFTRIKTRSDSVHH